MWIRALQWKFLWSLACEQFFGCQIAEKIWVWKRHHRHQLNLEDKVLRYGNCCDTSYLCHWFRYEHWNPISRRGVFKTDGLIVEKRSPLKCNCICGRNNGSKDWLQHWRCGWRYQRQSWTQHLCLWNLQTFKWERVCLVTSVSYSSAKEKIQHIHPGFRHSDHLTN